MIFKQRKFFAIEKIKIEKRRKFFAINYYKNKKKIENFLQKLRDYKKRQTITEMKMK